MSKDGMQIFLDYLFHDILLVQVIIMCLSYILYLMLWTTFRWSLTQLIIKLVLPFAFIPIWAPTFFEIEIVGTMVVSCFTCLFDKKISRNISNFNCPFLFIEVVGTMVVSCFTRSFDKEISQNISNWNFPLFFISYDSLSSKVPLNSSQCFWS